MSISFDVGVAYSRYHACLVAFVVGGLTAFLMSVYFISGYFVGNIYFWAWNAEQWLNGLTSLGLCVVLTSTQVVLYTKSADGAKAGTLVAILIVGSFSLLSEVGQGMDRDHIRMESKSLASPTYKVLVGSISDAATSTYTPYSGDLEKARRRLASCRKKVRQGIYEDCDESEAGVDAVNQMIAMANAAQAQRALALSSTAKTMERDENNYHPLVNLIRSSFGWTGVFASFSLALLIIAFFEYAFHYLGRSYAAARDLLHAHGYDTTRRVRRTPRYLPGQAAPADARDHSPAPATKSVQGTVQSVPADTDKGTVPEPRENNTKSVQGTVPKISERVFQGIYHAIKPLVINGSIKPTVRPVTDAVTTVIRYQCQHLDIDPKKTSKPQRQLIAQDVLAQLEGEGVIVVNQDGGVGKPKYLLAEKYIRALRAGKNKQRREIV